MSKAHRSAEARTQKGKAMGLPKKRWCVSLEVSCDDDDVFAPTADEAIQIATRRIENSGEGLYVVDGHAKEIVYERPAGTERWAPVADELRFAEELSRWFAGADGFWWWTNGHAALRCHNPTPDVHKHNLLNRSLSELVGDHKRREVKLGKVKPWNDVKVRRAKDDDRVCLNDDYVRLVECGAKGRPLRWMASVSDVDTPSAVPVLVYDESDIVAVVMGILDRAAVGP